MNIRTLAEKVQSAACQPEKVFVSGLVTAAFCTLSHVFFLSDIFRDTAHVYAVFSRSIGEGNFSEGIATSVPMLNIFLSGLLAYCGLEAVKALSLVAGVFYLLTCFPLRRFLERYVSPLSAAWGCVLYVCAPKMIRFACAPLLESTKLFFLVAAILYFLRCSEEPKLKNAVLFGLSAGFLAVSRIEGVLASLALLGGYWLFLLLFRKGVVWKKQIPALMIAAICSVAAVSPFCAMNYGKSGYFTPDARIVYFAKSQIRKFTANRAVAAVPEKSEKSTTQSIKKTEKITHDISCFIRGGYELYIVFALLGMFLIIKRKQWLMDYWLFFAVSALQCAIYIATVSAQRYYLFMIPLFMMFTLTGIDFVLDVIKKHFPQKVHVFCLAACAMILVGQVASGVKRAYSSDGKDCQAAGKWISEYGKKHFPDRKLVIFAPKMTEVAYWSGAVHTDGYEKPQHDPATFKDFDLAVVHRKKSFGMEKRADLERLNDTPHSKNIWIFKVKKQEDK